MSGFLWDESAEIAAVRPLDRAAIEKLDAFLHARKRDDVLDPRQIATTLGLGESQVVALLGEYCQSNVLRSEEMAECPRCQRFTPLEQVEEARADGVACMCESGDVDLLARPLMEVTIYQLVSEPPPRVS